MAVNLIEFRKYCEERNKRQGFRNSYEALAVAHNWKEVFGEDLPADYIHSRDYSKLLAKMIS